MSGNTKEREERAALDRVKTSLLEYFVIIGDKLESQDVDELRSANRCIMNLLDLGDLIDDFSFTSYDMLMSRITVQDDGGLL